MFTLNTIDYWKIKKSTEIISGCGIVIGAFLSLLLTATVQATDFKRLDGGLSGEFVARLAPVFDFDGNGCLPSSGISRKGEKNGGVGISGSLTENCRSKNFLKTSNTLHRYQCVSSNGSTYCGHFYAIYFEKDQISRFFGGHRHDWEYAAVWTKNGKMTHGSASAHGKLSTKLAADLPFDRGHLKIVYHKDGGLTHALRFAKRNEKAENPYGKFVTPPLVSWEKLRGDGLDNGGMIARLNAFDYDSATIPLKDDNFLHNLNRFKPSGYPDFGGKKSDVFTKWFSEERSGKQMCPKGYVVTGVKCKGRYCDNKQLKCSEMPGLEISGPVQSSPYFSEERRNFYKHDGKVVVGMSCKGRYCDKVSLQLRDGRGTGGAWKKAFSEESGQGYCGSGYVAGVRCTGRYCDNLSLYCKNSVSK
ncbi:NPP1 family protein [Endozoicomonas sp.]|uniref:NPP1 family protein n=1 Tax=Endozoicomonas sp. TaxID=1892382 RepID=UPI002886C9E5|nr:NPP1 family protein [Endozoicomonas sp.]